MLSALRKTVSPLQERLAEPLARSGVPADLVTLAGIPLSLGGALFLFTGHAGAALMLAMAAAMTDFLDGTVARLQNRESPFGNCLEAVVDRWVEGVLLVGLATYFPLAASSALLLSLLVSYVKARVGLVVISDNSDWPGVADRTDRLVLILLTIGFLSQPPAMGGIAAAGFTLWALAFMALIGCCQRLVHARKVIRDAERRGYLLPYLAAGRKSDLKPLADEPRSSGVGRAPAP
ncbi:MAG: CDP-alcohol phosphatidyltransferase family protein [Armatimonadetes bacterium]|nr:CDP-alcohol phosphatidyltransferase family protein [Armatimonadota bacterium]